MVNLIITQPTVLNNLSIFLLIYSTIVVCLFTNLERNFISFSRINLFRNIFEIHFETHRTWPNALRIQIVSFPLIGLFVICCWEYFASGADKVTISDPLPLRICQYFRPRLQGCKAAWLAGYWADGLWRAVGQTNMLKITNQHRPGGTRARNDVLKQQIKSPGPTEEGRFGLGYQFGTLTRDRVPSADGMDGWTADRLAG